MRFAAQDILDGRSETILVSEKRIDQKSALAGFPELGWASGTRATLRNTDQPPNAGRTVPPGFFLVPPPTLNYVGGFSSFHSGGVVAAFADGSVKFLKDSMVPALFQNLGNRADGEIVSAESF